MDIIDNVNNQNSFNDIRLHDNKEKKIENELLKHIDDFGAMNEEYAAFFTGDCPARAAFEVAAIPKGALVEIEAVAYCGK